MGDAIADKVDAALDDVVKMEAGRGRGRGGAMRGRGGRGRGSFRGGSMMGMRAAPYGRGGRGGQVCDNCGQPGSTGHAKLDCPNLNKTCDLCGKIGHLKFKCRLAQQGAFQGGGFGGRGGAKPCDNCGFVCGKVGHLKSKCRSSYY